MNITYEQIKTESLDIIKNTSYQLLSKGLSALTSRLYVRKHNPFIIMSDISSNVTRCANIVNADDIDNDLASADGLPRLSYYMPNLNNDAHNTNVTFAMSWFQPWFEERLKNPNFTDGTLFRITFDEDDETGDNQIYATLLGDPAQTQGPHTDTSNYNHYSILKTIEDNWGLDSLNRNDTTATAFTKFLQSSLNIEFYIIISTMFCN